MSDPLTTQPVSDDQRITAIDAARGLGLLGIFLVNIGTFAHPLGKFISMSPHPDSTTWDLWGYYFVRLFCEGKFYPLFSMLFGLGLALQLSRAAKRGDTGHWLVIRRLFLLSLFGITHVVLLWYGDILFLYSIVGVAVVLLWRLSTKWLVTIAIILLIGCTLMMAAMGALEALGNQHRAAQAEAAGSNDAEALEIEDGIDADASELGEPNDSAASDAEHDSNENESTEGGTAADRPRSPILRLFQAMRTGQIQGPDHPKWMELETEGFRDGPFLEAMAWRLAMWAFALVIYSLYMGWHVLAMMIIGILFARYQLLGSQQRAWQARITAIGFGIGLPLSGLSVWLLSGERTIISLTAAASLGTIGGTLMAPAWATTIALISGGALRGLLFPLAQVGRMALTVYIGQSVISTFVFYHWGLRLFGTFSHTEQIGFVFAVFAVQVVLVILWLSVFRMGPLEWLWRCVTYGRLQPLLKRRSAPAAA